MNPVFDQLIASTTRMDAALFESRREALRTYWILDTDNGIKALHGHRAVAEIGYKHSKPGRPNPTQHTYWIGLLRLVFDFEVQGGNASAAKHSLPRLHLPPDRLAPEERPVLVRVDSALGIDGVMVDLEAIGQRYLVKPRQTTGVKRLIKRFWRDRDSQRVGHGFGAVEGELQLVAWGHARRVVVLRPQGKASVTAETRSKSPQQELHFVDRSDTAKLWEYAVLVTNPDYRPEAIGQLYRDHADYEKGFDELKNPWG